MDRVVNMYVQSDFLFDDPKNRNHSAALLESSPTIGDVLEYVIIILFVHILNSRIKTVI
jgi:hypothetical protein